MTIPLPPLRLLLRTRPASRLVEVTFETAPTPFTVLVSAFVLDGEVFRYLQPRDADTFVLDLPRGFRTEVATERGGAMGTYERRLTVTPQ